MRFVLKRFRRSRAGNFSIAAALSMIPLVGGMGAAVDLSRAMTARSEIQDRADAAALSAARKGSQETDLEMVEGIKAKLIRDSALTNVQMNGSWTSVNEYTVTVSGDLPLTMGSLLPGVGSVMTVRTSSVARYREAQTTYKPPKMALLDPEAGDYNRVYAYCFDAARKDDPVTRGRSREIAIADNGGTPYANPFPACGAGETLSYRLYNVRNSRTNKKNWDSTKAEHYDYFTDTSQPFNKADVFSTGSSIMLETVLCPSYELCKPKKEGGVIPHGKNRTPVKATQPCAPGKFMYYGWEDRPPASGDRDYDDIRVIVECPTVTYVGEEIVRLIR